MGQASCISPKNLDIREIDNEFSGGESLGDLKHLGKEDSWLLSLPPSHPKDAAPLFLDLPWACLDS